MNTDTLIYHLLSLKEVFLLGTSESSAMPSYFVEVSLHRHNTFCQSPDYLDYLTAEVTLTLMR